MSAPTVVNGAVAVHHTATVDTPWDGPAAVAAMPNDAATLTYCHAWDEDGADLSKKSSHKLPHHRTKGGPANLNGVRNALARLPNTQIPAADKPGVERHLKAHLTDDGGGDDHDADDHTHSPAMNGPTMTQTPPRPEWFTIRNASENDDDGPAQVYIYDQIGGGGWFSSGISAKDFVIALADIKNSEIDLHINSPGGDVFDAIAIYNALRRHPANVTSYIDGLAASAASFIAQAGNKVIIERNAQFMVHDALGICMGNAADMAKMTDLLNKASDNIADIYSQRSGVDATTWRAVMQAEAWYSSAEAVTAGLADEVGHTDNAVTEDDRMRTTDHFVPVLKSLGARYSSRAEAPDPVLLPAASTRARRTGHRLPTTMPAPMRPADSLSAAHVIVEPAPGTASEHPANSTAAAPAPAPASPTPEPVTVTPIRPVFDADTFRAAIKAAIAA